MKTLKLLSLVCLLQISLLTSASVYFAPVKTQADLQPDDSIQIMIGHTYASSSSSYAGYMYFLASSTSTSTGGVQCPSCSNWGSYNYSNYWKNGSTKYGQDTVKLPNLYETTYASRVWKIANDESQMLGYNGYLGWSNSTSTYTNIYTYRTSDPSTYTQIGTFAFVVDDTRFTEMTGNVTITRTDPNISNPYLAANSSTTTSTSYCYYHFGGRVSASYPYYRVFRRVYHPVFDFKEIDGNDVYDINQLLTIVGGNNIFTFDKWTLPTADYTNEYFQKYIEIVGWYDAEGNPVGNFGAEVSEAGNFGEDKTYYLYYRLKQPISITGEVYFQMQDRSWIKEPLSNYATIPSSSASLINDTTILPNITLIDPRYQVVLNGWEDENGIFLGKPGDTVKVQNNWGDVYVYPVYTITPFEFTFDARKYSTADYPSTTASYQLYLPYATWKQADYESKYSMLGWFDVNTDTLVGKPGDMIYVYASQDLYMRYAGSPNAWFMRVKSNDELKTSGDLKVVLINQYYGYAAKSSSTPMINNTNTYGSYVSQYGYYYPTNGSSSTSSWSNLYYQDKFSLDLKNVGTSTSYDNNLFVWTITSDSSTYIVGRNGYWGSYYSDFNSGDYVVTYQKGYSTTIDAKIQQFNITINPSSYMASIDWVGWTSSSYRYIRNYSSSYFQPGSYSSTSSYGAWYVFRQAYEVNYEQDGELLQYGTYPASESTTSTITLPNINYTYPECANYIDIKGWYDENDELVGQPGDVLTITSNRNFHLVYEFKNFYKISFDAKEHGTCATDTVYSLLPFALPEVVAENGYFFKGWVSQTTDEIVGQAGSIYPADGAYIITADDDLYAVYEKSYDILEWGANSLTIECLNPCATVETKTTNGTKLVNQMAACQTDSCIYTLQVTPGDLSADEGQDLTVTFKDANGTIVSQAVAHIPAIVAGTEDLMTYHDPSICENTDLVVLKGGVAIASASYPFSFQNVYIQGGGKLVIPNNATLNVKKFIHMRSGSLASPTYQFTYPQMVVNGRLNNASGKVYYECLLNEAQYYNLTLPYDVNIADVTYMNGATLSLNPSGSASNALWVAYYDGATRATGASGWKDFAGATLKGGIGYTVAATPETVRPTGGRATQRKYSLVRFPMAVDLTGGETKTDRSVSVTSYPSQTGKDNDAGWNLVGNPYLADYGGAVTGLTNSNGIGLLVDDGLGGYVWSGRVRYVVLPNDQGTSYAPLVASASKLPAFKNFFVQIGSGDALGFQFTSRAQNAPARMLYAGNNTEEEEDNELMVGIKITRKGETETVGVLIGENHTDDYEINADLQKWSNPSGYNFYALGKGEQLSFIAVNEASAQNIELGYSVPDFGTITITADEAYDMSQLQSLMLTDIVEHKTVDLLKNKYTYSFGGKSKSDNRFVLSVVRKAPSVVTDLDKVPATKQPTKVFHNNHLYILSGSQVFDACGTLLK